MGIYGVIIFITVSVFALDWQILNVSGQSEESCLTVETGDCSSRPFLDYSCLGQCTQSIDNEQDLQMCETEMCSENITIPVVYTQGMVCVRGGQGVVDGTVTTTECKIVFSDTMGLQWHIVVSMGSLCKAICYNIAALLAKPHAYNPNDYPVLSTEATDDQDLHVLHVPPDSVYCTLGGSGLHMNKTEHPVNASGECKLEFVQSTTSNYMVPAVLATANPPEIAVAGCGVTCVRTTSTVLLKHVRNFTKSGMITTSEDCLYCSINDWFMVLPVSNSRKVSRQCALTRDNEHRWNFQVDGAPDLKCSVQCSCIKSNYVPNKTESNANIMT